MRNLNWPRIGLVVLVLIVGFGFFLAFKNSANYVAPQKDLTTRSAPKGQRPTKGTTPHKPLAAQKNSPSGAANPQNQPSSSSVAVNPAPNTPVQPTGQTTTPTSSSVGKSPALTNTGPGTTAALLFAVTSVCATLLHGKRRLNILSQTQNH